MDNRNCKARIFIIDYVNTDFDFDIRSIIIQNSLQDIVNSFVK